MDFDDICMLELVPGIMRMEFHTLFCRNNSDRSSWVGALFYVKKIKYICLRIQKLEDKAQ